MLLLRFSFSSCKAFCRSDSFPCSLPLVNLGALGSTTGEDARSDSSLISRTSGAGVDQGVVPIIINNVDAPLWPTFFTFEAGRLGLREGL